MTRAGETTRDVILLHGLWMGPWCMRPLASKLRDQGFSCSRWRYPSMQSLTMAARGLADEVRRRGPVHLVGHSLGGLLIQQMLTLPDAPFSQVARVVMLGTPVAGSKAAARTRRMAIGRRILGANVERLCRGVEKSRHSVPMGMIAGGRGLGLGRVVLPGVRGDGTVAVEETYWSRLDDHCVMPVTHSSMLWSRAVAQQTAEFLRQGRFRHD